VVPGDLVKWIDHPAFILTTTVQLDDLNVRDLCNSMRQMFMDPSSQRIIPLGDASSVLITSRASVLIPIVTFLQSVNESERLRREKLAADDRVQAAAGAGATQRK
jgi:hypothetical protein